MRFSLLGLPLYQSVAAVSDPVVEVEHVGSYRGTVSEYVDGVNVFKGIRYADPPTGQYRWAHPPHPASFSGVKNATTYGNSCPSGGIGPGSSSASEDCLFLNVWTPEGFTNTSNYPVFFWIYGGRFESGAGSDLTYDGSGLAKQGVVVVTMNYRLGALGFLAHPELSEETGYNGSGNWGLMDQQAALHWTNENIQNFGGNSSQITLGGQSAGAASVLDQVYSPQASGLFQGAIAESGARAPHDPLTGSLASSHLNLSTAEAHGVTFFNQLNVSTVAQARNLSLSTILGARTPSSTLFVGTPFADNEAYIEPPYFRPNIDNYILTLSYADSLALNNHSDVPILTGNNKDESGAAPNPGVNITTYKSNNEAIFEPLGLADEFFNIWPASNDNEANNQTNNFYRNQSLVSTWLWADAWAAGGAKNNVYTYYWTHAPPGQTSGVFHGSEINYALDNMPYGTTLTGQTLNWTSTDYKIADVMSSYWINFISTGNPNGDSLTHWAPSTNATKTTMMLGDGWGTIPIASEKVIEFIEDYFSQEPAY